MKNKLFLMLVAIGLHGCASTNQINVNTRTNSAKVYSDFAGRYDYTLRQTHSDPSSKYYPLAFNEYVSNISGYTASISPAEQKYYLQWDASLSKSSMDVIGKTLSTDIPYPTEENRSTVCGDELNGRHGAERSFTINIDGADEMVAINYGIASGKVIAGGTEETPTTLTNRSEASYVGFNADYCDGAPLRFVYIDSEATRRLPFGSLSPYMVQLKINDSYFATMTPSFMPLMTESTPHEVSNKIWSYGLLMVEGTHTIKIGVNSKGMDLIRDGEFTATMEPTR